MEPHRSAVRRGRQPGHPDRGRRVPERGDDRRHQGPRRRARRRALLHGPGGHRERGDQRGRGEPRDVPQLHRARGRGQPGHLGPDRRRRAGAAQEARARGSRRTPTSSSPSAAPRTPRRSTSAPWPTRSPRSTPWSTRRGPTTLGMVPGQRTAGADRLDGPPDRCAQPIEQLAGDDASVQMVDAVARNGLDPDVAAGRGRRPGRSRTWSASIATRSSAAAGSRRSRPGCRATSPPSRCRSSARSPATRFLFPQLPAALQEIQTAVSPTRSTRRSTPAATTRASSPGRPSCPTTPSAWRWTSTCPATSAARSARWTGPSSSIFKKWGFAWGGDWGYTDPMHFEMNRAGQSGGDHAQRVSRRSAAAAASLGGMRAAQVVTPTGPADVVVNDVPEPTPGPDDVLVEVHSVGISFPDLLLSARASTSSSRSRRSPSASTSPAPSSPGPRVRARPAGRRRRRLRRRGGAGRQPGRRSRSRCPTRCRTTRARRCR